MEILVTSWAAKLRLIRRLLQSTPKLPGRFFSNGILCQNLQRAQIAFSLNRFSKIGAQ